MNILYECMHDYVCVCVCVCVCVREREREREREKERVSEFALQFCLKTETLLD